MALEQDFAEVWDRNVVRAIGAGEMDENLALFAAHVGAAVQTLAAAIDGLRNELISKGISLRE